MSDDQWRSKVWERSQTSVGTTIPQDVIMMRQAPTGDDAKVAWRIIDEPGHPIEVRFVREDDPREDGEIRSDLYQRSENSYAATIPDVILRNTLPTESSKDDALRVDWVIEPDEPYRLRALVANEEAMDRLEGAREQLDLMFSRDLDAVEVDTDE